MTTGSTWGESWGSCWGDTWGYIDTSLPAFGAGRFAVPIDLMDAQKKRMIESDDLLLMIAGSVAAGILSA